MRRISSGLMVIMLVTSVLAFAANIQRDEREPISWTAKADRDSARTSAPRFLDSPPMEWNETYGGTGTDSAWSIVQTVDGGYALAGNTYSFGAGSNDFWLVKTYPNGTVQWNKTYGGPSNEAANSLVQTSDGGYAIAGYIDTGDVARVDFWLVKTDSDGNALWNQTYGGADNDFARVLVQTSDGGYAIAGNIGSCTMGSGIADFWLVKTDSAGTMQWNRTYGGADCDTAASMVQTDDGGYAIAGYTNSFGFHNFDFWLVKTDSSGNMQWNRTYDRTDDDRASSVIQTSDGGYAIAGYTIGTVYIDFWLVKTDSNGDALWNQTYGRFANEHPRCIVQTSDGGYALAGYTGRYGWDDVNFWLVKTDSNGDALWNQTYGGADDDDARVLIQTSDGGYAIAGYTFSYGSGNNDAWLIKLAPETPARVHGVDVSHYQGVINWSEVYDAGYKFAYAKATEGDDRPEVIIDQYFESNMNNGTYAGLLMGAYHFAHPALNDPVNEANFFVSVADKYLNATGRYLRPVLDIEDIPENDEYPGLQLGWDTLSNWIHIWMETVINQTGVEPILYVNSYYANQLNASVTEYDLWIAHWTYNSSVSPDIGNWSDWDFWQWSNESAYAPLGYVPGIVGNVDLNVFNGDLQRLNDDFVIYILGDVDKDGDVDIYDVVKITGIYGSKLGDPQFNPNSDLDGDGEIKIYDVIMCTSHYGQSWQP